MFRISSRQCHCVHSCNAIGLSSVRIAIAFVPKVESGEQADVPKVALVEQRVNYHNSSLVWPGKDMPLL